MILNGGPAKGLKYKAKEGSGHRENQDANASGRDSMALRKGKWS